MDDYTTPAGSVDAEESSPNVEVVRHPSNAHYYAIYDHENEQRATLIVVVSPQMRVLHAELWYYEPYRVRESTLAAIYQRAVQLLESDYLGNGLGGSQLRIYEGERLKEEIVSHHNPDPRYQPERLIPIYPFAAGYAAIVLILFIVLLLGRTILRPSPASVATSRDISTAAVERAAPLVDAAPLEALAAPDGALEPMPQAETNGLEPSVMADDRLMVGMVARIRPGYRSFVRSEPGPDAGESVGFLENGATARLLGGPVWKEGNTDTIVWWYVETETGIRGWTAANTSELTLLEPAE
jgi:hypothetical protein